MSLQVWLPLNGSFKNNGSHPSQDFELPTGGSWKTPADGVGRSGLMISNSGVTRIYPSLNGKTTCTVSVWFRLTPDSTVTNFMDIIAVGTQGGGSTRIEAYSNTNVNIFSNGLGTGGMGAITTPKGEWHHEAFVVENNVISRYRDGAYVNSFTMTSAFILDGSVKLGDTGMYCMLADVRVYDEALSAKQIKEISKGLVLHYVLKGAAGAENLSRLSPEVRKTTSETYGSGSKAYKQTSYKAMAAAPTSLWYCLSFDAKGSVDGLVGRSLFYYSGYDSIDYTQCYSCQGTIGKNGTGDVPFTLTDDWKRYWVVFKIKNDSYFSNIHTFITCRLVQEDNPNVTLNNGEDAWVRNVKLEVGTRVTQYCPPQEDPTYSQLGFDSAIEKDLSGFGHDSMTIYTLPDIDTTSPRYCTAYDFAENTAKRVRTQQTHDFDFTDNFTWSCWVKTRAKTDTSTGAQYAFSVGRATLSPYGYGLHPNNEGTKWIASFGSEISITIASNVPINTWHHFAFTKSGTTLKTFMDGELKNTITFSGTLPTYSSNSYGPGIGFLRYYNGTTESIMYPLNGCVSDFRIYATALSDDDIRELYASPASIDNQGNLFTYELNETSREKVDISQNGETHTNMFTVFTDNGAETPSTRATKTSFYEDNKVVSHDFIEY